jgi:preprotein translocase subunit SecY
MDEVVSKWGIGSGVSLFIAAGVTKTIFVRAFNPFVPAGLDVPAGHVPAFIVFLQRADIYQALLQLLPIISTIIVFLAVVYIQAIRVDIPLAFTSIRGFGRRWPLKFIYTSNIPVILTAALFANLIIFGNMLASRGFPILGEFKDNRPQNGFLFYISEPHSTSVQVFSLILLVFIFVGAFAIFWFKLRNWKPILIGSIVFGVAAAFLITFWTVGLPTTTEWAQLAGHLTFYAIFCMLFSILWIATSGMDPKSVAEQIESLGMQIPGFRRDTRIVEDVLSRYIPVLAVLGGLTVGLLASVADLTGAMGTGTGILLTVMIIYNFYEIIATRYVEELHPSLRGLFR